jgi:hypothetical protein
VALVDGVGVFPQVPTQLRGYHKSWERNECIKAAMKLAESEVALLQKYISSRLYQKILEVVGWIVMPMKSKAKYSRN